METSTLLAALARLEQPRVLVVGDFILDRYTWGDADCVSQEAPVILLRADRNEWRLGGAGNVCQMVRGLDASVDCAGVVGEDDGGETVRGMLAEAGVGCAALVSDSARPTTVKQRFIGRAASRHPHQILRVDREIRDRISAEVEREILDQVIDHISEYQVILISDYDKGVCTPQLLRQIFAVAHRAEVPIIVDPIRPEPGSSSYDRYRGATGVPPNRLEAELATGIPVDSAEDASKAGKQLCRRLDLKTAIVTLDRDGMALVRADGDTKIFPTRARAVYDITGAGDMVLSMIGVCQAAGLAWPETLWLANVAAGLEVEHVGVAVIPRDEIRAELICTGAALSSKLVTAEQMSRLADNLRAGGKSIALTNGCFDLFHVGHLRCLEDASRQGDCLVVAVNSDAGVRRLKGPERPVIGEADRAAILAGLGCVDFVVIFDEDTPHDLLQKLRPDVLVKGGTYEKEDVVGHEIVTGYGGRVHLTDIVEGFSTSAIVRSIAGGSTDHAPHFVKRRASRNYESGTDIGGRHSAGAE